MEELENTIKTTLYLNQKHINFLNKINKNQSLAARIVLDSIISGKEQKSKREMISNKINWIAFGIFFFMLLFIVDSLVVRVFSLLFGIGLITMTVISVLKGGNRYEIPK